MFKKFTWVYNIANYLHDGLHFLSLALDTGMLCPLFNKRLLFFDLFSSKAVPRLLPIFLLASLDFRQDSPWHPRQLCSTVNDHQLMLCAILQWRYRIFRMFIDDIRCNIYIYIIYVVMVDCFSECLVSLSCLWSHAMAQLL